MYVGVAGTGDPYNSALSCVAMHAPMQRVVEMAPLSLCICMYNTVEVGMGPLGGPNS